MKGLVAVTLGMLALGCGGSSGGGSSSGVTGSKRIDSLTDAEKVSICDWTANKLGGYGHVTDCGNGLTLDAPTSQADCTSTAPTNCAATVSQYEACLNAQTCANPLPSQCAPLIDQNTCPG